jgi:hypothetical protein
MKKNLVVLSVVAALSLMSSIAFAGPGVAMHISVPFEFYLEDQLLPAGEYHFEMGSGSDAIASRVTVLSKDGEGIRMISTLPGNNAAPAESHLCFNQYGEKHFLSGVSIRGYNATLKVFKLERELRAQFEKAKSVTLVAQN